MSDWGALRDRVAAMRSHLEAGGAPAVKDMFDLVRLAELLLARIDKLEAAEKVRQSRSSHRDV